MKLSVPIYRLKRIAKKVSREEGIPLSRALDRVAAREGYGRWSLLSARHAEAGPSVRLLPILGPGDLVLVGARPLQGKTLLCFELAVEAMRAGRRSFLFTLEETEKDILDRFRSLGLEPGRFSGQLTLDCRDAINADHIIRTLDRP